MSDLSQTSKRHVHSKQLSTKWVTDIIQEGWPVGLRLAKMGHWKGKQIIYSCVDLVAVFVPLVTLPFQVSEDLIWAVSKYTTWRQRGACRWLAHATSRSGGSKFSVMTVTPVNSLETLHEYGLSWGKEWASWSCQLPGSVGRRRKADHVQRAEVGGHVWWRTSESQGSEGER